jgi:hypothetical protein
VPTDPECPDPQPAADRADKLIDWLDFQQPLVDLSERLKELELTGGPQRS